MLWGDGLAVGVSLIDDEHKHLFEILNRLGALDRNAEARGPDYEQAARGAIDDLFSYSHYHFSREEELMLDCKCARFPIHKKQHDNFIAMISTIGMKRRDGGNRLPELAQYVKRWILGHIAITDKALGEFLRMRIPAENADFPFNSVYWAC